MRQVPQLKPITLKGVLPREKACQRWCYPGGHGHRGAIPTAIVVYSSQDNDMQVVSFSEARESFKAVLDRVETDADVTLITRRHAMEQAGRDELLVHRLIEPDQADAVD